MSTRAALLVFLPLLASQYSTADMAREWILQGTVEQFNEREVVVQVEDGKSIVIPRSALGGLTIRPGATIRYAMPMEALKAVRAPRVRKPAAPSKPPRSAPANEFVPSRG